VIQSYLWPVAVAPLFNRFEPVRDTALVSTVKELSAKAGLPVEKVLVMDASRRTTRANAYFSGIGKTKQIVLYDTLLRDYPLDEVEAVVAHEMAHWRQGHILKGIALGILGSFLLWAALFLVIRTTLDIRWYMHYPAHTWIVAMLFFLLASFAASPAQNYFSRLMEKEADRVSVTLTENPGAAVRLQLDLAMKNLSDPAPPWFIRWFSYSHPAVLDRISIIREAGAD
jgi:STE24 endopeptidase